MDTVNLSYTLVYPHQLYANHPALSKDRLVVLLEDSLFFGDYEFAAKFHKQKLVLHRASMKLYATRLEKAGYTVLYKEWQDCKNKTSLENILKELGVSEIHVVDPTDEWLSRRITATTKKLGIKVCWYESPNFLTSVSEIKKFFTARTQYFHHHFYQWQRKRLNILMNADGTPKGGKWSFDTENRERLPRDLDVPTLREPTRSTESRASIQEAFRYVEKNFPENPGTMETFLYPLTHEEANEWWQGFLEDRFRNFGPFEDAVSKEEQFLFHSVLTPSLNIGLLDPKEILDEGDAYAHKNHIPMNSLEGFVRQIIGWREYMRAVYLEKGSKMRTTNFFDNQNRLSKEWYQGTTGLDPVDLVIRNLQTTAYAHHIERLMILGNAMLLCQFHPDEVYRWFMEMYIDAYDWVMVPNVYGMSQFADGGSIVTKPYISSSRYILKMSDFEKGSWCEIWDGLFWNFISEHRTVFENNQRMRMMVSNWDRQSSESRQRHIRVAKEYLRKEY